MLFPLKTQISKTRISASLAALLLLTLALSTPWLADHGRWLAAILLRDFFHAVCHQRSERSLWILGGPVAVCFRCLGIYAGAVPGAWLRLQRIVATRLFFAVFFLNCADVATEMLGLHPSLPLLRLALGALLGISAAALLFAEPRSPETTTAAI